MEKHEIEFVSVKDVKKNADAIIIHYIEENGTDVIGIYDTGFESHGKALVESLRRYYFTDSKRNVDFMIISHSDEDHASGAEYILDNVPVKSIYMNRPWRFNKELLGYLDDKRRNNSSLKRMLRETYPYVAKIEDKAIKKQIPIYDLFQGQEILKRITILAPAPSFYFDLLCESNKIPDPTKTYSLESSLQESQGILRDEWKNEYLTTTNETSSENEMSIVCFIHFDDENVLLTGDAGIRNLRQVITYLSKHGITPTADIDVYQVPHHGGRHNLTIDVMNDLVGDILEEDIDTGRKAFVSTSKNSGYPRKVISNSFIKRGIRVYSTNGSSIRHHKRMGKRVGWSSVACENFSDYIEPKE